MTRETQAPGKHSHFPPPAPSCSMHRGSSPALSRPPPCPLIDAPAMRCTLPPGIMRPIGSASEIISTPHTVRQSNTLHDGFRVGLRMPHCLPPALSWLHLEQHIFLFLRTSSHSVGERRSTASKRHIRKLPSASAQRLSYSHTGTFSMKRSLWIPMLFSVRQSSAVCPTHEEVYIFTVHNMGCASKCSNGRYWHQRSVDGRDPQ